MVTIARRRNPFLPAQLRAAEQKAAQQNILDRVLGGSTVSLQNLLGRVQGSLGTDVSQDSAIRFDRSIAGAVRAEIQRRNQASVSAAATSAFAALEKDFFGKFDEAVASQDFKFEQITEASRNFDVQLGNFQREQEDIERGNIISQSQINMGSQNNLLLIAAVVAGVFFLG